MCARVIRSGLFVQVSGRKSRRPTITGTSREAKVTETSDWQLDVLPSAEAYCGATPTECCPFFGNAVSSMTRKPRSSPTKRFASFSRAASIGALSQTPVAMKW